MISSAEDEILAEALRKAIATVEGARPGDSLSTTRSVTAQEDRLLLKTFRDALQIIKRDESRPPASVRPEPTAKPLLGTPAPVLARLNELDQRLRTLTEAVKSEGRKVDDFVGPALFAIEERLKEVEEGLTAKLDAQLAAARSSLSLVEAKTVWPATRTRNLLAAFALTCLVSVSMARCGEASTDQLSGIAEQLSGPSGITEQLSGLTSRVKDVERGDKQVDGKINSINAKLDPIGVQMLSSVRVAPFQGATGSSACNGDRCIFEIVSDAEERPVIRSCTAQPSTISLAACVGQKP